MSAQRKRAALSVKVFMGIKARLDRYRKQTNFISGARWRNFDETSQLLPSSKIGSYLVKIYLRIEHYNDITYGK